MSGPLRPEFASEDLLLLLVAHAAVVHVTREDAPSAGRRFVALMLDAFGPQAGPSALPVPPSWTQMRRAMVRLAGERGCGERGCGEHGLGTTRLTQDAAGNAADDEGPLAGPGPASRPADRSDVPG